MGGSGGSSTSSNNNITRWNPTKDQIRILEGLYGQGMRTPTADQIQRITSRLRSYGHIEGKNVFYWFQNHKARQRQKEKELQQQQQQQGSCLRFSYMNRHCLYFQNRNAAAPGLLYGAAPSPSSANVVFRPYYVAQNETAGDIPALFPLGSNSSLRVADDGVDHAGRVKLSLSTSTPFGFHHNVSMAMDNLANDNLSTLDLFPVNPTGIEHGGRMISLADEDCSGCMEECGGGDMPERPFFDFLSVNR